jgi:acyl-CoA synthetase (AMP-forming)/AMP-acid ligase II
MAVLTESGHVRLVGRTKDMIIRGGVNIYPAEIEAILGAHPDITEASVFGLPDKDLGEVVAVAVVAVSGASLTEAAVLQYVRERLALYKVPQRVTFVAELPRNPSGKILKSALPAIFDRHR